MLSFTAIVHKVLETIFRLGGEWIKDATFVRPVGLNPSTGLSASSEDHATCKMLYLGFHPMDLALVPLQPGDEKILIRSEELATITNPGVEDRIVETASGLVRRVLGSRLDVTGEFWLFQAERTADEDWGDLTTATLSEDRGDLGPVTVTEELGRLF